MSKTALLLIDLQNDYFEGGKFPLHKMDEAAAKAQELLAAFRTSSMPVIHVRHENAAKEAPFFNAGTSGANINEIVTPQENEPVVVKANVNSFHQTNLKETLDQLGISSVIIAGAMSCLCVDAVTRAAADMGLACSVAHDACAAPTLEFDGEAIPAQHVHGAFMAALGMGYANVTATDNLIKSLN